MHIVRFCLVLSLFLSVNTLAEVYKHTDAEGNVVYTDTPDTVIVSEKIEVEDVNVSDPVAVPSGEESEQPAPQSTDEEQSNRDNVVEIPDTHNEEVHREFERDMPHEVLDAEQRHEVGDFGDDMTD